MVLLIRLFVPLRLLSELLERQERQQLLGWNVSRSEVLVAHCLKSSFSVASLDVQLELKPHHLDRVVLPNTPGFGLDEVVVVQNVFEEMQAAEGCLQEVPSAGVVGSDQLRSLNGLESGVLHYRIQYSLQEALVECLTCVSKSGLSLLLQEGVSSQFSPDFAASPSAVHHLGPGNLVLFSEQNPNIPLEATQGHLDQVLVAEALAQVVEQDGVFLA